MNLNEYKNDLLFLPLGGAGEIGMNLNLYQLDGKWLMVDCGVGFADDHLPGADLIVPDTGFIEERRKDLLGLVVTHAHEDHVGAIPYLWDRLRCPVYTTAFTAAVLRAKLAETEFAKEVQIHEIKPGDRITLGKFEIEPVHLTHSIPEMNAIAIRTPHGMVLHTGDWKFDPDPLIGPLSDEKRLKELGEEGVLALVCDSTNVFSQGESGSEAEVQKSLNDLIGGCKNRVVVTTFASNLARLNTILEAARNHDRQIVVCGRSLWRIIEAAKESGYLTDMPQIHSDKDYGKLPRHKTLVIGTGCQGEPMAAMTKIADGTHPSVRLAPGDTVIFSSKVIPGNEQKIFRLFNKFVRMGLEVLTEKDHFVHVSGHPYRGELTRMYQLAKPKIAIPVHGEARHIHEHAKLARDLQVPQAVEVTNGEILNLSGGKAETVGMAPSGIFAIDGNSFLSPDSNIMRDRRRLRLNGAMFISLVFSKKSGNLVSDPQISAPGSLDRDDDKDFIQTIANEIREEVEMMKKPGYSDIREAAMRAARRLLKAELDKKPYIEVHIAGI